MALYKRTYGIYSKEEVIGEYKVRWPEAPNNEYIANCELPKKKQKFRRTELPKNFHSLDKESEEYNSFVAKEFNKRVEGYWFYSNGVKTYITGAHYFYLNYWPLEPGLLPEYRDNDRRFFLLVDHCIRDPHCLGLLYFKNRRDGATTRACCIGYHMTTLQKGWLFGIQSKTETDAKQNVFAKKIVRPWNALPSFFRPVYSGNDKPKDQIQFTAPTGKATRKRLLSGGTIDNIKSLDSSIEVRSSTATAFDGEKLHYYFCDEFGKTKDVDIIERHEVVRECSTLGDKFIGFHMYTSTIEEVSSEQLGQCKLLWERSNPNKRDENGHTLTGLYRYIKPADDGLENFIDEYGMPLRKKARKFIENKLEGFKNAGDSKGAANYKRKFPLSIKDALTPSSNDCSFDQIRITSRKERIETLIEKGKTPYITGNLVWENNEPYTRVIFKPSEGGKFKFSRDGFPGELANNVTEYREGLYRPENNAFFKGGIDPYDYRVVENSVTSSKGAGMIYRKDDPSSDSIPKFVCMYLERPSSPTIFYNDMIKMCWFYGCEAVIERNKENCRNHFHDEGLNLFVMGKMWMDKTRKPPKMPKQDGEYTSEDHKQSITGELDDYISQWCEHIDFPEFLDQLLDWKPHESTKFDLVIAGGYALIGSKRTTIKKKKRYNQDEAPKPLAGFYRSYQY